MKTQPLSPELEAAVASVWQRARDRWATALLLSMPVGSEPDYGSPAAIDFVTRQIVINETLLVKKGLHRSLEALVAHEVGHHVAFPGSLVVEARLRLTERALLPFAKFSLTNLFTDLLINERLGHELKDDLVAIYVAFAKDADAFVDAQRKPRIPMRNGSESEQPPEPRPDFAFTFVMCAYEELWKLPPGTLLGERGKLLDRQFPGARADAQLLVERLFVLGPNLPLQYLFFLSVLTRYLIVDEDDRKSEPTTGNPCPCGGGEPAAEDWAEALSPTKQEEEALERALKEGWLSPDDAERLRDGRTFERRIAGLPGQGSHDASSVPEVMAAWYRRQAASHLLKPPAVRLFGEATVPVDLQPWEPGDPLHDVDWAATLREHGPVLGKALPLVRDRLADEEGLDTALWAPRTEVYVDVSGSMPDPRQARNALTLAAMILTVATTRAGGAVRALLYSGDHVKLWTWTRSDVEVSRFLMHYIGGGTAFPFDVLQASVEERAVSFDGRAIKPIRVVITDRDFDANVANDINAPTLLQRASSSSAPFVLLQSSPDPGCAARYKSWGMTVVPVQALDDFPKVAAGLARALFPDPTSRRQR